MKQLRQRLSATESEYHRLEELLAKSSCEAERCSAERNACENRVQAARSAMNEIRFDSVGYERVQSQLRKAEERFEEANRAYEKAETTLDPNLQFSYPDPEPGFDRSRVKGMIAHLIEVRNPHYTRAVEAVAGNKLYNVIVDNEKTGQALLKQKLQRHVTMVPLTRITHHTLPPQKVIQAQHMDPSGSLCLALTLVGYAENVQEAIEFVFGSTLVCESLEVAQKVAFSPNVRVRTATVGGEVVEPSGVLEGGSRKHEIDALASLASLKRLRTERDTIEDEMKHLRTQFNDLSEKHRLFSAAQSRLELELHNLEVLESSGGVEETSRLSEEVNGKRKEMTELNRSLSEAEETLKRGAIRLSELEAKEKAMRNGGNDISELRREVESSRLLYKEKTKAAEKGDSEMEELLLEAEELREEVNRLRSSVETQNEMISKHSQLTEKLEARVRELKEAYEQVKREASEKKEEVRRQSEEIRSLEKQLDHVKNEMNETESKLKAVSVRKAKLQKARKEAENRVESLLSAHPWLGTEESEFGKAGTDYDFGNLDMTQVSSRIESLEEEQEQLGRRLNKKVLGMMEKAEGEYQELLKKRRIIENDRSQIEKVIEELDVKKRETLASTYEKVNRDFGSIFSTLLPGASARLEPPAGGSVLDGLEVRVAFGGKEKESLSELSGGQRSLLALSLVLSLLLFKPAPMYILDEIDAALDLSHTQNIGRMLRQHFSQSQFIVVSLKEGMFNNANVIFRTKFIDGVSTVTRTEGMKETNRINEAEDNKTTEGKRRKRKE